MSFFSIYMSPFPSDNWSGTLNTLYLAAPFSLLFFPTLFFFYFTHARITVTICHACDSLWGSCILRGGALPFPPPLFRLSLPLFFIIILFSCFYCSLSTCFFLFFFGVVMLRWRVSVDVAPHLLISAHPVRATTRTISSLLRRFCSSWLIFLLVFSLVLFPPLSLRCSLYGDVHFHDCLRVDPLERGPCEERREGEGNDLELQSAQEGETTLCFFFFSGWRKRRTAWMNRGTPLRQRRSCNCGSEGLLRCPPL